MSGRVGRRRTALAALAAAGAIAGTVLTAAAGGSLASDAHAAAAFACQVDYTTNDWGRGFGAEVTVANVGSAAVDGWTLTYTYAGNQTLQHGWSGNWSQAGNKVTVTNTGWNGTIAAGGTVKAGANVGATFADQAVSSRRRPGLLRVAWVRVITGSGASSCDDSIRVARLLDSSRRQISRRTTEVNKGALFRRTTTSQHSATRLNSQT